MDQLALSVRGRICQNKIPCLVGGRKEGWMGGRMDQISLTVKGRIYQNKIPCLVDGWVGGRMEGRMDGSRSRVKDCIQQSKIGPFLAYFDLNLILANLH